MIEYISSQRKDGIGSQLLAKIAAISMAYRFPTKYEYVHTQFSRSDVFGMRKQDFTRMEFLLGFVNKFKSADNMSETVSLSGSIYPKVEGSKLDSKLLSKVYSERFLSYLSSEYATRYSPDTVFDNDSKNIVIHLRRGVNMHDHERLTREKNIRINSIRQLRYIYEQAVKKYPKHIINIFTTGIVYDIAKINKYLPKARVYINGDDVEIFHSMVMADVLFIGKSTFSFCAGLFNRNGIIYKNLICDKSVVPSLDRWSDI